MYKKDIYLQGILFGNSLDCDLEKERLIEENLTLKTNRAW